MWNSIPSNIEGGRHRLPSFLDRKAIRQVCLRMALAALLCLLGSTSVGAQQRVFVQHPGLPNRQPKAQRPAGKLNARVLPNPPVNTDPEARRLLLLMLHPKTGFVGVETTQVAQAAQGNSSSQQTIKGDAEGNIIRFYTSPDFLKGDVMLIKPDLYAYYSQKSKKVERLVGGRQQDKREQKMLEGLDAGRLSAQITGRESIYGRNAAIITIFQGRQPAPAKVRAKFWIDPETGIKLQMELMDGHGIQTSRSTLQITAIGPEVVSPKDFEPAQFTGADVLVNQRENFKTLEEALQSKRLPFQPVQPAALPEGFHLSDVAVVTPANPQRQGLGNVVLRFTNGTVAFTLHERIMKFPNRPGGPFTPTPNLQRWRTSSSGYTYEIVYRGKLAPEQMAALKTALNATSF